MTEKEGFYSWKSWQSSAMATGGGAQQKAVRRWMLSKVWWNLFFCWSLTKQGNIDPYEEMRCFWDVSSWFDFFLWVSFVFSVTAAACKLDFSRTPEQTSVLKYLETCWNQSEPFGSILSVLEAVSHSKHRCDIPSKVYKRQLQNKSVKLINLFFETRLLFCSPGVTDSPVLTACLCYI